MKLPYEPVCMSVGRSFGWLVGWSVGHSVCHDFLKGVTILMPLSEHLFSLVTRAVLSTFPFLALFVCAMMCRGAITNGHAIKPLLLVVVVEVVDPYAAFPTSSILYQFIPTTK